jgi:hypothetical protein
MLEHKTERLLPRRLYILRLLRSLRAVFLLIVLSLIVGTIGYRFTADMSWVDAFYNASLILSGMGPATELETNSAKIFASFYSLYSGLAVIAVTGMLLMPVFHRILHKFHVENKNSNK